MAEALQLIEKFMDDALMVNATSVEIVHGKGSGILRKATLKKLNILRPRNLWKI